MYNHVFTASLILFHSTRYCTNLYIFTSFNILISPNYFRKGILTLCFYTPDFPNCDILNIYTPMLKYILGTVFNRAYSVQLYFWETTVIADSVFCIIQIMLFLFPVDIFCIFHIKDRLMMYSVSCLCSQY